MKRLLPDLRIIVLVGETKRENIAYFYEIGVNNVISKPASMNNIIEKMAFTIKPQGKLSEYMGLGKRFLAAGKLKEALDVSTKILKSNRTACRTHAAWRRLLEAGNAMTPSKLSAGARKLAPLP